MKTCLSTELLGQLACQGRAAAAASPFVDPTAASRARRLIEERGEEWAASVLLRDLSRRSQLRADLPWLHPGELETLIAADRAEFDHIVGPGQ